MKKFLAYVFLLVALLTGLYLIPHVSRPSSYEKVLPEKLQVTGVVAEGDDWGLLDSLAFRREACGAIVFSLAPGTIEALKRDGLSFLADARQARGYPDWFYYHYGAWKETPVPSDWFGDGVIAASLHCAEIDPALWKRIQAGGLRAGGFYATKDEGQLIVLPDEGIAIFTYYG